MMFISLNSAYMCIAQNRDKAQKRGISVPKVLPKPIIWWRGLKRSHITPDPSHRTLSIDIDNHPARSSYSEVSCCGILQTTLNGNRFLDKMFTLLVF